MLLTSSIRGHLLSLEFHPQMVTGIQHLQTAMSPPMDQNYQKIISKRSKTIQLVIKSACAKTTQEAHTHVPSRNTRKEQMHMMHNRGHKKPCTPHNDEFMTLVDLPPTSGSSSKSI